MNSMFNDSNCLAVVYILHFSFSIINGFDVHVLQVLWGKLWDLNQRLQSETTWPHEDTNPGFMLSKPRAPSCI